MYSDLGGLPAFSPLILMRHLLLNCPLRNLLPMIKIHIPLGSEKSILSEMAFLQILKLE